MKSFLQKLYLMRGYVSEVTVTLDTWQALQSYKYENSEFHLLNCTHNHDEPDVLYVYGIKVTKGIK